MKKSERSSSRKTRKPKDASANSRASRGHARAGSSKAAARKGADARRSAGKPSGRVGRSGFAKPAGFGRRAGSDAARADSAKLDARRSKPAAECAFSPKASACPVSHKCGGCQTIDVPYEEQLASKQRYVEELFADLAPAEALRPILGMDEPFFYRNKVISPYAPGRKLPDPRAAAAKGSATVKAARSKGAPAGKNAPARREILTGMYAKGTHRLVPTDECLIENRIAKKVTLAVRDIMLRHGIEPYDEDAGTGFIRHVVVRVGHNSGEVLVTVVTNGDDFPSSKSFCRELIKRVPQVTTVVQNVNTRSTNVILGEQERTLYGPGFILDTLCGLSFRISSHSFYQVNSVQTEVLYRTAIDLAELSGSETVVDAYCGTGTIGLTAAKNGAARVIGVDNVESAIADARLNARHNGVENAEFVAADAGAFMRDMARRDERDVVLFMDPPRAGSSEAFLDAAAVLAPKRIVCISCNPVTQVRDIAYLRRYGYRVDVVQAVDMFPHTEHVETVVALTRRAPGS